MVRLLSYKLVIFALGGGKAGYGEGQFVHKGDLADPLPNGKRRDLFSVRFYH